ncbi:hypothetical protein MPER_02232, partial [Moniliophthora perniciosa FA553]
DGKKKEIKKPEETSCDLEFRLAKTKLFCQEHSKAGLGPLDPGAVFCYIMQGGNSTAGKHKRISPAMLGLWARQIHDGKADPDFTHPPNELVFDDLNNTAQSSFAPSTRGSRRQQSTDVHVHFDKGFVDGLRGESPLGDRPELKRKRSESDKSEVEMVIVKDKEKENPPHSRSMFQNMPIDKNLDIVHARYPELDYHQYRPEFCQ